MTETLNIIDVKAVRDRLGMTQSEFALRFGFQLKTLQNWEQGIRQPAGPSRTLLMVIDKIPHHVQEALSS